MAETPISGLVLRRSKNGFINDAKEEIEYFDALVFDPETFDLVLVRSGKAEGLSELAPGTEVVDFPVEVLGTHKITVVKSRPVGMAGANVPEFY